MTLRNILVATDFSEASTAAFAFARDMARAFNATLHVLHVTDNILAAGAYALEGYTTDWAELQREVRDRALTQLDQLLLDHGGPMQFDRPIALASSDPAQAIASYAKEAQIDLLVVGTHGRGGMAHLLMGSVAERVVRTAPCPVLTVRQPVSAPAPAENDHAVTLV